MNSKFRSISEYLIALNTLTNKGITFVLGSDQEEFLSYHALYERALSSLKFLQDSGFIPGTELVFQIDNLKDFIVTYWACILGGFIPVPLSVIHHEEGIEKLSRIWKTLSNPHLVSTESNVVKLSKKFAESEVSLKIVLLEELKEAIGAGEIYAASSDDIAFIQFSSGSTGDPKGVKLTHGNLLANIEGIVIGAEIVSEDKLLSWMPLTHDMGLIGFHLVPLALGADLYLMPTELFIRNPTLWMKKASEHKITITSSPNFGYQHFLNQLNENNFHNVDLSSLRLIFNGAEPISANICRDFLNKLKQYGLKENVMFTVYGLAEASLAVTFPEPSVRFSSLKFDRRKLGPGEKAQEITIEDEYAVELVNCGTPIKHCSVLITDESHSALEDGYIGFINIKGANVTSGYYNNQEASNKVITGNGWLNTGDLGFIYNGCLYITGRMKELIFLVGQNVYPHDIERIAQDLDEIEAGKVVACGIPDEKSGLEKLVLFVLSRKKAEDFLPLAAKLKRHIAAKAGIEVSWVVPIKKIPKTTSGKIQRVLLADDFIAGAFTGTLPAAQGPKTLSISSVDLEAWLCSWLSNRMNVSLNDIDLDTTFAEQGVTSLMAVELARAIEEKTGKTVSTTVAWSFPNIRTLTQYLIDLDVELDQENNNQPKSVNEPIAIIGMACRFPGATNLDEYWHLLKYGKNSLSEIESSRWNKTVVEGLTSSNKNKTVTLGNYLKDIDLFDASFFGISPKEATEMDPQQRLLLELAWEAMEHAGIPQNELSNTNTAVYIGASGNEYVSLTVNDLAELNAYSGTGNALSILANRLSYFFNLCGASMAVDTACSSSLVALHQACQQLRMGESDTALVGGVNLMINPALNVIFSEANMLAEDGKCKTFDQQANGYSRGEGGAIVILKRLSDAIKDQNTIHAVIRGSALNQDGKSNGLTAPNGRAQKAVIQKAMTAANVQPLSVSYMETHGTGTPLGDPIEYQVLDEILQKNRSQNEPCWIGSAKTNIGHLEAAAGMAGLIKTVLSFQNKEIPQHLNFNKINPYIENGNQSVLKIPTEHTPWIVKDGSRIAGVSAFGFGGTNAHVILEEGAVYQESVLSVNDDQVYPLVLSAKNKKALEELTLSYQQFLNKTDKAFKDICYTAAFGRTAFTEILHITASCKEEAAEKLALIVEGIEIEEKPLSENWKDIFKDSGCNKVTIPGYPFQRQRYWVNTNEAISWLAASDDEQFDTLDEHLYEINWIAKHFDHVPVSDKKGSWLIFSDTYGIGDELAQKLKDQGHFVFKIFKADVSQLDVLLQVITESITLPWMGFIYLWSLENTLDGLDDISFSPYYQFLDTVKKINNIHFDTEPALWLLTKNALFPDNINISGLFQSPFWGFAKSVPLEYPKFWCGIMDIGNQEPAVIINQITQEVLYNRTEDFVVLRNDQRNIFRLAKAPEQNKKPFQLTETGSYLITGGLGYLGLKMAKWLALNGAGQLILSTRKHPDLVIKSQELLELEKMGANISIVQLDLGNAEQIQDLVNEVQKSDFKLKGVFHAAGISNYKLIEKLDNRLVDETLEPKIKGAWFLHESTQVADLDFFVCFSSITSIWGGKEQSHYAAANQFLDSLAYYRKNLGLPSLTVNLGPVFGGGMATENVDVFKKIGVGEIHTESLFAILSKLIGGNSSQKMIAKVNWEKFQQIYQFHTTRPVFDEEVSIEKIETEFQKSDFLLILEKTSMPDRPYVLLHYVREVIGRILGYKKGEYPNVDQGLFDMGMDSISAVNIKEKLEKDLQVKLNQTVVFDYPSIQNLVDFFIVDKLSDYFPASIELEPADKSFKSTDIQSIAIDDLSNEELENLLNEQINRFL